MKLTNSKCPTVKNWDTETSNTLAYRLSILAEADPKQYAIFKRWEAYYLSRRLSREETRKEELRLAAQKIFRDAKAD